MSGDINEMKLTAFALGELHGTERDEAQALIASSDEARLFVQRVRETAEMLSDELLREPVVGLLAVHHAAIERQLESEVVRPLHQRRATMVLRRNAWREWAALGLTAAASILIVVGTYIGLAPSLYPANVATSGPLTGAPTQPPQTPFFFPRWRDPLPEEAGPAVTFNEPFKLVLPGVDATPRAVAEVSPQSVLPEVDHSTQAVEKPVLPTIVQGNRAKTPSELVAGGRDEKAVPSPSVALVSTIESRGGWGMGNRSVDAEFVSVVENPLSSFAVDVENISYLNVRRFLSAGRLPPAGVVRVEELINYFPYAYAGPKDDAPFAADIEVADCPWNVKHRLVRIGVKGREVVLEKRPPANLVFMIDVSEAMDDPAKLPLIKGGLRSLIETLTPADRVSFIVYGGATGVVLPPTSAKEKQKIIQAIDNLHLGGPASAGDGIEFAYTLVTQNFSRGGANRVILCTDANYNVGGKTPMELDRFVSDKARSNIPFSVLVFGAGSDNDWTLKALAMHGGGLHAYVDTPLEAVASFAAQAQPPAAVVARDVKVQVEFNPFVAGSFKLIGFDETPALGDESELSEVAGGSIHAGETITALYEVALADKTAPENEVFALVYQKRTAFVQPSTDLLTVKMQFKPPGSEKGKLVQFAVKDRNARVSKASSDFRFAAAVADFGLSLRSRTPDNARLKRALKLAKENIGADTTGYRQEFVSLVEMAMKKGK